MGLADPILDQRVRPDLDHFAAVAFEEAALGTIARLARANKLPFLPERIGSWWDKEAEIDVLAVSDTSRALLAGECKWSIHPVGINVFEDLQRKVDVLRQGADWRQVHYALFARRGFTPEMTKRAEKEGITLVEIQQIVAA